MFLDISEKEYRALPVPSYSLLANIEKNGVGSIGEKVETTESMIIGSMVDTLLFEPEEFKDRFHVGTKTSLTGNIKTLAEAVSKHKNAADIVENSDVDVVLAIMDKMQLYKNVKNKDKRIALFNTKIFWKNLSYEVLYPNKTIVSKDLLNYASKITEELRNHENSRDIFEEAEGKEILFQPKLKFEFQGYTLKAMYDIIVIDHDNKIIKPIDLKVSNAKHDEFEKNFNTFKYRIQAGLYTQGLRWLVENSLDYYDYEIDEFDFLVYSRSNGFPMRWAVPAKNIDPFIYGYDKNHYHINGVVDLLKEYYHHVHNPNDKIPLKYKGIKRKYLRGFDE